MTFLERWVYRMHVRRTCPHPSHRLSAPIFDARGELRWCYECRNQAVG